MKTFFAVLAAAVVTCADAPAQTKLDLPAALAEAAANNPELRASRARIEAATGRAVQACLWPNPNLELTAEEVPVNNGGLSRSQTLAGVGQTVPFPGKKALDSKIGAAGVTAAEWEYLGRELEVLREVKTAFWRALAAQKKLATVEELAALARSTAAAVRKRVQHGAAPDQEQLRAEIEEERAAVTLTGAQREQIEAQKSLAPLLGRRPENLGALAGELSEQAQVPALEQSREQMLARHPNVRAVLANRDRAELELRRAKLDPLPDVTLGVAAGRDNDADTTLMAFRVSVPLPIFDRAQGRKREARANADIARYDLTTTELRLARDLAVTDARLRSAAAQVESYRARILPKADGALRLVRSGYYAGKLGLLDLLDTQRTTVEARLAYYDKLLELNVAQAELESLLMKDLQPLQPETNPKNK
ncbi:MAG: TolC family protein [Verrucomicrobia bacterium]|nr:TolC family protein [Verrucomicrobiota bacterium]